MTDTPANSADSEQQPKMTRAERRAQDIKKQLHARRHRMLFLLVGITLLINAGVGYWLYGSMVEGKQRQRVADAAAHAAQSTAQSIATALHERQALVKGWAQDPALVAAMEAGDAEALAQITGQRMAEHPELLALRAFAAGKAQIDREHQAPLRYAEIDLIRRSTRRQETLPEAAPIDGQWQLQIASAVPPQGEGDAPGSLLATFDTDALKSMVTANEQDRGTLILQQSFSSHRPYPLHRHGSGDAAPPAEAKIPGSYLSVHFTPSQKLVEQSAELPGMWLLVISLCVTTGLALSLVLSRLLVRSKPGPTGEGLTLPQQYVDTRSADKSKSDAATDQEAPQPSTLYQNQDILDIEVIEEDADILGLDSAAPRKKAPSAQPAVQDGPRLPDEIFRSYDIRGKVGAALTPDLAYQIGLALGSEVQDQGETSIVVARDGRSHSPELCQRLVDGLLESGCDVTNIGTVPTPVMHFAVCELEDTNSGVMVTASHNGAEYNGFKMVIGGQTLADGSIQDIRSRIASGKFLEGEGKETHEDITPDYIDRIFSDVALAGQIRIVIDAGNAITGVVAPALFEELGCEVIPLHCELDGRFPNHPPDPSLVENLQDLIAKVKETEADLGVAFDGDGDRLVVVTPAGKIIWPDHLLMLFAKDILSRNPGADVLFDVKCSKQLNQLISSYGGRPIMWKTGHSHMKRKMAETGALLGGEYSGHIFIKERWYGFDDGLYTAARLLEIITLRDQPIDDVFAAFPMLPSSPEIRVPVAEADKFKLIERLIAEGDFQSGKATTIDGLRVDFSKGWGLVRASNTAAEITLRFEAESEETLNKLQQLFKRELLKIDKTLKLDF